ncbi:ABC transporter permease [Demequina silvatica]|uniref:ABC transporter permease n=1 Tax=Demequina silvatica TaxID=1638988 RepID=UPI0007805062|nr:ABC transporter permease [Demequina silvatica]
MTAVANPEKVAADAVAPSGIARPLVRRRVRRGAIPFWIGVALLAITVAGIVLVPLLPGYDPMTQDLSNAMLAPFTDPAHLLGTDPLGRDILSRLALAGRTSLIIAAVVIALNVAIGITIGLAAGYFGGLVDNVMTGIADIQLAMPFVLLLIALSAVFGPSTQLMVIMLGITFWVGYGRVARAMALSLREREYVLAPKTQGAGAFWILRKHLLPAVLPQLIILASFDVGVVVTAQAALDFLGLGVQPPTPSWGGMIAEGQKYLQSNVWLVVLPGLAMLLLIAGSQLTSRRFTAESGAGAPGARS